MEGIEQEARASEPVRRQRPRKTDGPPARGVINPGDLPLTAEEALKIARSLMFRHVSSQNNALLNTLLRFAMRDTTSGTPYLPKPNLDGRPVSDADPALAEVRSLKYPA